MQRMIYIAKYNTKIYITTYNYYINSLHPSPQISWSRGRIQVASSSQGINTLDIHFKNVTRLGPGKDKISLLHLKLKKFVNP